MSKKPEIENKQPISVLLDSYIPRPSDAFYQRMKNSPWNTKEKTMISPSHRPIRWIWQAGLALALVIIILSVSIPGVRAAISAWLGLSVAPSNQMPLTGLKFKLFEQ